MSPAAHKIGVGEKGQRTARSTNVYQTQNGLKETTVCPDCRLVYRNKRWQMDPEEGKRLLASPRSQRQTCPACRRIADRNPAGIIALSGAYLEQNWSEIQNLIRRVEEQSVSKSPLGRIMAVEQGKTGITITTTEDKMAQKIGREIFRAHKGELIYSWSHDQQLVRVTWNR
jgi:NMD protein affecting ribosome stability and mRNA decay